MLQGNKLLNVITLGHIHTDNINQMITITISSQSYTKNCNLHKPIDNKISDYIKRLPLY